jgi:predicted nucleic acid-binding protein
MGDVVAAAIAGRADAIVTGDRDLLEDGTLRNWLRERGVDVMTPAELLERL